MNLNVWTVVLVAESVALWQFVVLRVKVIIFRESIVDSEIITCLHFLKSLCVIM